MDTSTRDLITKLIEETYELNIELVNLACATSVTKGLRAKTITIFRNGQEALVWPRQNPKTLDMKLSNEKTRLFGISLMNKEIETEYYSMTENYANGFDNYQMPTYSGGYTSSTPNYHVGGWPTPSVWQPITSWREDGEPDTGYKVNPKGRNVLVYKIADLTKSNPKRLLIAINNIRRIQDWCHERISGLKRLIDNNHKQQEHSRSQLSAEETASALANPGPLKMMTIPKGHRDLSGSPPFQPIKNNGYLGPSKKLQDQAIADMLDALDKAKKDQWKPKTYLGSWY